MLAPEPAVPGCVVLVAGVLEVEVLEEVDVGDVVLVLVVVRTVVVVVVAARVVEVEVLVVVVAAGVVEVLEVAVLVLVVAGRVEVVVVASNEVVVVLRSRVNRVCSTAPADANAAPIAVTTTKANNRYRIGHEPRIDPASRNHQDGRTVVKSAVAERGISFHPDPERGGQHRFANSYPSRPSPRR